mmetsp:Transcript_11555/g.22204  ORF Transcript_11555/g.22204 Transcript_11555/m.22204 type:complete len:294 (+) Transcript_11555:1137-2018(+)
MSPGVGSFGRHSAVDELGHDETSSVKVIFSSGANSFIGLKFPTASSKGGLFGAAEEVAGGGGSGKLLRKGGVRFLASHGINCVSEVAEVDLKLFNLSLVEGGDKNGSHIQGTVGNAVVVDFLEGKDHALDDLANVSFAPAQEHLWADDGKLVGELLLLREVRVGYESVRDPVEVLHSPKALVAEREAVLGHVNDALALEGSKNGKHWKAGHVSMRASKTGLNGELTQGHFLSISAVFLEKERDFFLLSSQLLGPSGGREEVNQGGVVALRVVSGSISWPHLSNHLLQSEVGRA